MTNWILDGADVNNRKHFRLYAIPQGIRTGTFTYMVQFNAGVLPSRYFNNLDEVKKWLDENHGAMGATQTEDMGVYTRRFRKGIVHIEGGK
jgi:hypothetical protein